MDTMHWTPPNWVYVGKKPRTDDEYFSNLTRVIFTAGLNWNTIDTRGPGFMKAFEGFQIDKIARYNERSVTRLMADPGIVRNKAKIEATIHNAKEMQAIRKQHGSFSKYLDSLRPSGYDKIVEDLSTRFRHVGKMTAETFLWSVGEDIEPDW